MAHPEDLHEYLAFDDPEEDRTWVFDVTFLTSGYLCIFGQGCQGVLTAPAPELMHGCCSYGAHFTDADDRAAFEERIDQLDASRWQFRSVGLRKGLIVNGKGGDVRTRVHDGACIMLNRPGFPAGPGCALHQVALERGERPLDWKPEVCWQLPLRRLDSTDEVGHVTSTVREWKRRDWGDGGHDFHWWCTEAPEAFVGAEPVYVTMADELAEMVGAEVWRLFLLALAERGTTTALAHPTVRRASV